MDGTNAPPLLALAEVRKSYNLGQPNEAEVLHGLSLQVDSGEFVALIGPCLLYTSPSPRD